MALLYLLVNGQPFSQRVLVAIGLNPLEVINATGGLFFFGIAWTPLTSLSACAIMLFTRRRLSGTVGWWLAACISALSLVGPVLGWWIALTFRS